MRFLPALLVLGCAGSDGVSETTPAGSTVPGATIAVPDPGDSDADCLDTEPNDSPEQAVPCGPVHEDPGLGTGAVYPLEDGAVDASDPVDWYVFATGPDTDELHQFAWWTDVSANLVDLAMYEVTDTDIVEIWRSEETASDGENLAFELIAVKPATTYLLEVIYVDGTGTYGL